MTAKCTTYSKLRHVQFTNTHYHHNIRFYSTPYNTIHYRIGHF